MGCLCSSNSAVQPLNQKQDEAGCNPSVRGDSAGSKVTTDSGVVMESRELVLPGSVPNESAKPSLLLGDVPAEGRLTSSEILEELWSQGIIPDGEGRQKESGAAFCIMDESRRVSRLPARLESLKLKKVRSHTREDFDEKMRLVEERRKLREDEMKTRLRTITSHGRRPAPVSTVEEDTTFSPVESLQLPKISAPPPASALHSHILHKAAVVGEWVKEAAEDRGELQEDKHEEDKRRQRDEEEEVTQVEELQGAELLPAGE